MKKRIQLGMILLLIVAIGVNVGVLGQTSVRDEFAASVATLLESLDRALYLAIAGFSAYDREDQLVVAQGLINLLEGPDGANYDESIGELGEGGMVFNTALNSAHDWTGLYQELCGSEIYVLRDAVVNTDHFVRLAYYAALEARDTVYSQFGPENAFRTVYAHLVAARGGFEDPFLVAGIHQLAALFPSDGSPTTGVVAHENELQTLLQDAPDGGTIRLESGVYRERVVITRDVTIQGVSPEETILEGVAWEAVVAVMGDKTVNVVLEDLTIRSGEKGITTSVYFSNASVTLTLKNVTFLENGTGLVLGQGTLATCTDCRFEGNDLAVRAFTPDEGARASFTNCVFDSNERTIEASGNQAITLNGCLIRDGADPNGNIVLAGSASLKMRDSELRCVSGRGIVLMSTASMALINNVIETEDWQAIAIASPAGPRGSQDCGIFIGLVDAELPPGMIVGHGNAISGEVCPASLLFLTEPGPTEMSVAPGESIQAAIDAVSDGGIVTIGEGTYHENLDISRSLTLVGDGKVTLIPSDREIPAIRISESTDVVVQGIQIEDAATGIETSQASCRISGCLFRTTNVAIQTMLFGSDTVRIEDCTFTGEETAGQGILTLGDGRIEIEDCEFLELATGAILAGMVSARITTSTFEECPSGILISSTVHATLEGNRIRDCYAWGIRIAAVPFDAPAGSLVMVDNVIENRGHLAISLCGVDNPNELTLTGSLEGSGNVIEGGPASLCPADYEWPAGFFADE